MAFRQRAFEAKDEAANPRENKVLPEWELLRYGINMGGRIVPIEDATGHRLLLWHLNGAKGHRPGYCLDKVT